MLIAGYPFCVLAAREAGQKNKEALYRKKALEAASAISKNFENWLSEKMNELIEKSWEPPYNRHWHYFASNSFPDKNLKRPKILQTEFHISRSKFSYVQGSSKIFLISEILEVKEKQNHLLFQRLTNVH